MKEYKPPKPYKDFVLKTVEYLRLALNLHSWTVYVRFVDHIGNHSHVSAFYEGGATAEMKSEAVYMTIDITVSKKMESKFTENRLQEIREDLCHELVHQFLARYYDFADRFRGTAKDKRVLTNVDENTTQVITMVLMKHIRF